MSERITPEQLRELEAADRKGAESARERARFARETFNQGRGDIAKAIAALARSFPCLTNADGLDPWDAHRFAEWAKEGRSHGERCAVQFILSVWNPSESRGDAYALPYFDVQEALGTWDRHHQQAFLGWAEYPWWP